MLEEETKKVRLRQAVTLKEVAEHASVSLMTVSAVLNGKSAERRISDSTQRRVREAARHLDYRPNAVARSLRRQSTNVIGVYSGLGYLNASNMFLSELIGGLQAGCDVYKKDLLLHGTFRGLSVDHIYSELVDGRLDGLVVQAPPSDPLVERLAASHLPVVAIADTIPSVPSVVVDDTRGMRLIVEHLAERGHRRIVHIYPQQMIVSAKRRRAAVLEMGARHGITIRECSDAALESDAPSPLRLWLEEPAQTRPTAIVAWSDQAATKAIEYCRFRGLRVPEDLAVTGFDGLAQPSLSSGRLTTVHAPWNEVGQMAIALLVDFIEKRPVSLETTLPVEFVPGDTA